MEFVQCSFSFDEAKPGGAPSKATLIDILTEKRKQLLAELRDIEQAVEALEGQPNFEPMFNKLSALLQRRY